ncbi:MAG: monofunctional biosynthetic peptidoglycan transglycosylase [Betaproteobacteria bacterium]|nr:monofunctional biosynthetic peptidoglycan transglycosylase [Betaproteobacteria bacterium]
MRQGAKNTLLSLWKWLRRFLFALVLLIIAYQFWLLGWVLYWKQANPGSTPFMELRLAELRAKNPQAQLKWQWVDYDKISPHLKRAIIASEDAKFIDHEGFDWESIQKAMEKNRERGRIVAGASTISQQLAKNLFLSPRKTFWRKAEEALITLMIEQIWSKQRIFEVYLNIVEWGDGVFGAEAAAWHYYGVPAGTLSPQPSARLAAMLPNPRFYDRNRASPALARKTAIILLRMPMSQVP